MFGIPKISSFLFYFVCVCVCVCVVCVLAAKKYKKKKTLYLLCHLFFNCCFFFYFRHLWYCFWSRQWISVPLRWTCCWFVTKTNLLFGFFLFFSVLFFEENCFVWFVFNKKKQQKKWKTAIICVSDTLTLHQPFVKYWHLMLNQVISFCFAFFFSFFFCVLFCVGYATRRPRNKACHVYVCMYALSLCVCVWIIFLKGYINWLLGLSQIIGPLLLTKISANRNRWLATFA